MVTLNQNKVRNRFKSFLFLWNLLIIPNLHFSTGEFTYEKENINKTRNLQDSNVTDVVDNITGNITGNVTDDVNNVTEDNTKYYSVQWSINLGDSESLLEHSFLKAGLTRAMKDHINDDLQCNGGPNTENASFYNFEIISNGDGEVSGKGLCMGSLERCKWEGNLTSSSARKTKTVIVPHSTEYSCDTFHNSTIFDSINNIAMPGVVLSYDVDVGVVSDLDGALDLTYDVSFNPVQGDGLNQITSIEFSVQEPKIIYVSCPTAQCILQRATMFHIYRHFGISIDPNMHECHYHGVNCNSVGLVSQIWLGEFHMHDFVLCYVK